MKNLIYSGSLLSILFSCKKETKTDVITENPPKIYDTIKPSAYFPVYPGSYWKYLVTYSNTIPYSNPLAYNTSSTTVSYTTSSTNKKDSYSIQYTPPTQDFHSDTFLVPFYEGVPVWADKKHVHDLHGTDRFVRLVSDSLAVGAKWFEYNEFYGYTELSIRTKDTTLVMNGQLYAPVIIVRCKKDEYGGGDGPYQGISDFYYAKNIGLLKTKTIYTSLQSHYPLEERILIDYHINK